MKRKRSSAFPLSRIKKMMQADDDVGKIANAAPILVSKALAVVLEDLIRRAGDVAKARNTRTISPQHLKYVVMHDECFDFLKSVFEKIPSLEGDVNVEFGSSGPAGSSKKAASVPSSAGASGSGAQVPGKRGRKPKNAAIVEADSSPDAASAPQMYPEAFEAATASMVPATIPNPSYNPMYNIQGMYPQNPQYAQYYPGQGQRMTNYQGMPVQGYSMPHQRPFQTSFQDQLAPVQEAPTQKKAKGVAGQATPSNQYILSANYSNNSNHSMYNAVPVLPKDVAVEQPVKKKRGRPPKNAQPVNPNIGKVSPASLPFTNPQQQPGAENSGNNSNFDNYYTTANQGDSGQMYNYGSLNQSRDTSNTGTPLPAASPPYVGFPAGVSWKPDDVAPTSFPQMAFQRDDENYDDE